MNDIDRDAHERFRTYLADLLTARTDETITAATEVLCTFLRLTFADDMGTDELAAATAVADLIDGPYVGHAVRQTLTELGY